MSSIELIFPLRALAIEDPVGFWTTEPSFPYTLASHEVAGYGDRLFVLGGSGAGDIAHSEILATTISPDGSLSSWQVVANLPLPIYWASVVINGNRIYHIGGAVYPPAHSIDSVYTATINADGTFSGWTTLIPLPQRVSTGKAFIYGGRIYYIGGATYTFGGGPLLQSGVYSAQINEDGTIEPWQSLTPLPQARYELTAFLSNNKLIVMGGATTGTKATNSVIAATINPLDGTIGSWETLPSLPDPSRRPGHVLTGGYFILLGGYDGSVTIDSIYYAPVNPDGTPGAWTKSSKTLPTANCCFPLVEHNGYLYMTGGHNGAIYLADVSRARLTGAIEAEPHSVVLLPGLGASWNKEALICNQEVGWEDWEMTPGIHHYDGIIQTFQDASDAYGFDFHVFNYDWTQPATQSAEALKTFLDSNITSHPDTKVDLVGHSLGGLVARAYLQKYPDSHGVDQIITLGSPHKGAPQAYYAWEGANFKKLLHPIEAYGAMLLIIGRRGPLESLVKVIQEEMPSLKDLLPIFPYLKRNSTGEIIPLGSMSQRNVWLPGLFPIPADLLSRFNPFIGLSGDTTRWLRVVPRVWGDSLRNMWEDGRPVEEEYATGDKTVLAESSRLDGASNIELSGLNHSELVTTVAGQEAVLDLLGITGVSPTPGATDFSTRAFVAALLPLVCPLAEASIASPPVGIRIINPLGQTAGEGVPTTIPEAIYRPEDQLILIPGALEGNYRVEVVGNPGEDYHLAAGEVAETQEIWIDRRDEIGGGGVDSYPVELSQDPQENQQNLLALAQSRLEELQEWLASYPNTRVYRTIRRVIGATIRMIEGAERYLEKNKTSKAKTRLRVAVLLIGTSQKYIPKFESAGLIPAAVADKILFETAQVRDYLLQTLELLSE